MGDQHCDNCRYYNHNESECRKSSPVGIAQWMADAKPVEQGYWDWNWPTVSPDDWCGEWAVFQ
jgi:hypothetical protein